MKKRKAGIISSMVAFAWIFLIFTYHTYYLPFLDKAMRIVGQTGGVQYYNSHAADAVRSFWFNMGILMFLGTITTIGSYIAMRRSAPKE